MSSIWGDRFKISLFGESHGAAVGVTIDGLPAGTFLQEEQLQYEMKRRAPGRKGDGQDKLTTPRTEADCYEILSGFVDGHSTGTPLSAVIRNTNTYSKDYSGLERTPRPGHADYTGHLRYKGMHDVRGGGHFSARVTAGLVFAGAVAKQVLDQHDIHIGAHLRRIYDIEDMPFQEQDLHAEKFRQLAEMRLPVLDLEKGQKMADAILEARQQGDSVGGIIETAVIGMPGGYGDPFFDSVESKLSHILFAVPGMKGLEFGAGFEISRWKGSKANDPFYMEGDSIRTKTNHNGGINGGITNGMPIIFRAAMKPTPSIAIKQDTVDLETRQDTDLEIKGRHDPCIAVRGLTVIEAAAAVCLLDILLSGGYL